jgi:hypothetical protein
MDKFVLNKGTSNEFILTIKQNNSTLPMLITDTDTFSLKLYNLETNSQIQGTESVVTVHDMNNGQIKLVFPDALVESLISERGKKEDRYYLKPTYRIVIDCDTTNNGKFVAKIPLVYVSE